MSLRLDFTIKSVLPSSTAVKNHKFMDVGTSNYYLSKDEKSGKVKVMDANTTNFDKAAIKNSLNNILNFRTRRFPIITRIWYWSII